MCVASAVGDFYKDKWNPFFNPGSLTTTNIPNPYVNREEFESLRKEVLEMKDLLIKAKVREREMSDSLNKFQIALCKTYADGDFAYIAEPDNAANWRELAKGVGDTLFTFLMLEIADEGSEPMTRDELVRRLERAYNDVGKALWDLDRSYPNE